MERDLYDRGDTSGEWPYEIFLADSFQWMDTRDSHSIHAIVTDPPYGLKEYTEKEEGKLHKRHGGVWHIPLHLMAVKEVHCAASPF
jgi:DNA modification methylase